MTVELEIGKVGNQCVRTREVIEDFWFICWNAEGCSYEDEHEACEEIVMFHSVC